MRIGIVGTGPWATQMHGAGARAHSDVELVGVWGRDAGKVAKAAAELGCAGFPSYAGLLEQVDAVAFAVPPDVQAPLARQAAEAGVHLLLEKPLALTVADADAVENAVERSGVTSVMFLTRLWEPETSEWLDELRAQGGWDSGRCDFVAALPEELLHGSPWRVAHGALWDVGPHVLSVLERVLGPVQELVAVAGARDLVHLRLGHVGGAVSTAELSLTAPLAAAHKACSFWGRGGFREPPESLPGGRENTGSPYAAALSSLVEQVRTGRRDERTDAAYGAHQVRVLAAAEQSLADHDRKAV